MQTVPANQHSNQLNKNVLDCKVGASRNFIGCKDATLCCNLSSILKCNDWYVCTSLVLGRLCVELLNDGDHVVFIANQNFGVARPQV